MLLHALKLSPIIEKSLANVVVLQVELLRYAASGENIKFMVTNQEKQKKVEEVTHMTEAFAKYLKSLTQITRFRGREDAIAQWCWNGPEGHRGKKRQKHLEYLEQFVWLSGEQEQKQQWCERIAQEVNDLLDEEKQIIPIAKFLEGEKTIHIDKKDTALTWQGAAYCFFLYFYDAFLGNSADSATFPGELSSTGQPFGRQAFFEAFIDANQELIICPICDASRYYVKADKHIYGTIDHFLPKSLYPHFACHPYNLIPTCHGCNSWIKSTHNPLQGEHALMRSMLPYTQHNGGSFYLHVTLKSNTTSVDVGPLIPHTNGNKKGVQDIEKLIDTLKSLYKIPGRWQADTIGETLFRRMRQYLDNGRVIPGGNNLPSEIYNSLEQLLYYLDQEDRQKDPLAFALTWTLVAFIKEQLLPYLPHTDEKSKQKSNAAEAAKESYLLKEIERWFSEEARKEVTQRSKRAQELLSIPTNVVDHDMRGTDQ
ncbi:hypothetical protein KSF_063250 [Reticulibacter mediterranei]|uniref:HNH endonuclease n=1 Tax=Reticulibacter mediterranei TaxID=2778369 RepID=A0A8J3N2U5_9CHLR|nr:hypothetical protein [Reticulibacter mediterranei]GHO96277.1 hypothetical protein KSF_063250 [Reticulibacter mediterranei]